MLRTMRAQRALVTLLVALAVGCSAATTSSSPGTPPPGSSAPPAAPVAPLHRLHATRGEGAAILDDLDRQVLLRGVNLNGLGDYYQANPALPSTVPVDDRTFSDIAAQGFDVVRLIVSWSLLEPERGRIDDAYIQRIRTAVNQAKAHGVYVVLDMHQDAWGKYIASPAGTTCADGSEVAIGWDGAPQWATITDGADTCRAPGNRESSQAVQTAFKAFYDNRDGLQDELATSWAELAGAFAGDPAVAGYDLLNEPNPRGDLEATATLLGNYEQKAITAIRKAEQGAGGFDHIVFAEPIVLWPIPAATVPPAMLTDTNLVFAPHLYNESIGPKILTIEQGFAAAEATAAQYGTTFWIGEWGFFGDPAVDKAKAERYAKEEDAARVGGTWWQWVQACGDPHSVGKPNGDPGAYVRVYSVVQCPGDRDRTPVPEYAQVLGRAYPRATAGMLTSLSSDSATGMFAMQGTATDTGGDAAVIDLWVPDRGKGAPSPTGTNVRDIRVEPVAGGFRVRATACGQYALVIGGPVPPASGPAC